MQEVAPFLLVQECLATYFCRKRIRRLVIGYGDKFDIVFTLAEKIGEVATPESPLVKKTIFMLLFTNQLQHFAGVLSEQGFAVDHLAKPSTLPCRIDFYKNNGSFCIERQIPGQNP